MSNQESKIAKIQATQAILVALIGALATIVGAYIATSNNNSGSKKSDVDSQKTAQVSTNTLIQKDTNKTLKINEKATSKVANKGEVNNTQLADFQKDVISTYSQAQRLLNQIGQIKKDFNAQLKDADESEKFKIKDQIIRLDEIYQKIKIDQETLQELKNVKVLNAQTKNSLSEIIKALDEIENELAEF